MGMPGSGKIADRHHAMPFQFERRLDSPHGRFKIVTRSIEGRRAVMGISPDFHTMPNTVSVNRNSVPTSISRSLNGNAQLQNLTPADCAVGPDIAIGAGLVRPCEQKRVGAGG